MKTYRQAITEALPEPYASLAIGRCSKLDDKFTLASHRVITYAFPWEDTPEGECFWDRVDDCLRGRDANLPSIPVTPIPNLESRISALESRVAALESPAVVEESATVYPTTPLPDGYDKWVCRGSGWKPGFSTSYTTGYPGYPTSFDREHTKGVSCGHDHLEYWEAVREEPAYPTAPLPEGYDKWVYRGVNPVIPFGTRDPEGGFRPLEYWEAVQEHTRYRLLVPGEVIREGDQYLDNNMWYNCHKSSGKEYREGVFSAIRRPITTYTDAP